MTSKHYHSQLWIGICTYRFCLGSYWTESSFSVLYIWNYSYEPMFLASSKFCLDSHRNEITTFFYFFDSWYISLSLWYSSFIHVSQISGFHFSWLNITLWCICDTIFFYYIWILREMNYRLKNKCWKNKSLSVKIGHNLFAICLGSNFGELDTEIIVKKIKKFNKCDYIKLQCFCRAKNAQIEMATNRMG